MESDYFSNLTDCSKKNCSIQVMPEMFLSFHVDKVSETRSQTCTPGVLKHVLLK